MKLLLRLRKLETWLQKLETRLQKLETRLREYESTGSLSDGKLGPPRRNPLSNAPKRHKFRDIRDDGGNFYKEEEVVEAIAGVKTEIIKS